MDSTITDKVFLDVGMCSTMFRVDRKMGDKSILCEEPTPTGRIVIGVPPTPWRAAGTSLIRSRYPELCAKGHCWDPVNCGLIMGLEKLVLEIAESSPAFANSARLLPSTFNTAGMVA